MDSTNEEPQETDSASEVSVAPAKENQEHTESESPKEKPETTPKKGGLKGFFRRLMAKKKLSIPLAIVLLLAILLAVPITRYPILGTFLKSDFYVTVVDSANFKTVSGAQVSLGGQSFTTNGDQLRFHVKVGKHTIAATKKYYKDYSQPVTVPIKQGHDAYMLVMVPTGRQVPVQVMNKITGKPASKVTIKVADTQGITDDSGKVTLSLPPDKDKLDATLSGSGYNDTKVTIKVIEAADPANTFTITPAGKLYFLSKLSGKIDVVKTDLDGTNRQTVLAGSGKEDDTQTILLASRDWNYLALKSHREGDNASLYLIDTSNDKLSTIDEGNADFTLTGWQDHMFIYTVYRKNIQPFQPNQYALKSFNAETTKLTTLDQTAGEGTNSSDFAAESYGDVYAFTDSVVFVKNWSGIESRMADKQATLSTVKADGSGKAALKSFAYDSKNQTRPYISTRLYESEGLYFKSDADATFYKFEDGKVSTTTDINQDTFFNSSYPTSLLSPDGKQTFWSEERDGKNTLFIGDGQGKNEKQIASLSEFKPYGWFTNDYLLVSKNSSELFIMPVSGQGKPPLKVSDYHKPAVSFTGYGGGYGGL